MNILNQIDDFIIDTYRALDYIKYLTPINVKKENKKFLKNFQNNIEYNPKYKYCTSELTQNILKIKKQIQFYKSNLKYNENILDKIFFDCLSELEDNVNLYNFIGDNKCFTDSSVKLYGIPSDELFERAMGILKNKRNLVKIEKRELSSKELKDMLSKEIAKKEIDWEIIENSPQSSKVTIDPINKKIFINADIKYSKNDIKRLRVHEFGVHVLRAENGEMQPYKVFKNGLANSLSTEEGLATYMEEKFDTLDQNTLRLYAGRVVATRLSLNNSFYQVFKELKSFFSMEDTLYIVSRIKRGLSDTGKEGAFTKDYVYLKGYYNVKEYLKNNNLKLLYVGSIGIDNVEDIKILLENEVLKYPQYLVDTPN